MAQQQFRSFFVATDPLLFFTCDSFEMVNMKLSCLLSKFVHEDFVVSFWARVTGYGSAWWHFIKPATSSCSYATKTKISLPSFFFGRGGGCYGRDGFSELTVSALKYVLSLSGRSVIWCRLNTTDPFTPSWHLVKWDGLESAAFIHKLIWDLIKVVECFT